MASRRDPPVGIEARPDTELAKLLATASLVVISGWPKGGKRALAATARASGFAVVDADAVRFALGRGRTENYGSAVIDAVTAAGARVIVVGWSIWGTMRAGLTPDALIWIGDHHPTETPDPKDTGLAARASTVLARKEAAELSGVNIIKTTWEEVLGNRTRLR